MRTLRTIVLVLLAGLTGCRRDLEVPVPQRGVLRGSVDTGGRRALGGIDVALARPTGGTTTTATQADGTFVFDDLPPGTYTVRLTLANFAPLVEPAAILSGQTTELPPLQPLFLAQDGTVRGRVLAPAGASSVAGAAVEFRAPMATQAAVATSVGLDGTFTVRVPDGTYQILASHPAFTSDMQLDVQVIGGTEQTLSDLQLGLDPATISGVALVEVDGQAPTPTADTFIAVDPGGALQRADPLTGAFTVGGLAPGEYRLRVEHAGHSQAGGAVPVTIARAQQLDAGTFILMLDRGAIEGTVQMGDGLPPTGVQVTVTGLSYGAIASPSTTDQSLGTFRISGVPVGTNLEVVARKEGYLPAPQGGVAVRRNETTRLTAPLQLAVSQGQFQLDDGNPFTTRDFTGTRNLTVNLSNAPGAVRVRISEDPSFADAGFGPFAGAPLPFTLADLDGLHQVYAQWEDAQNVRSATLQAAVLLDRVPPANPSLSIEGGAAFTRATSLLALSLSAVEGSAVGPPVSGLSHMRISSSSAVDAQGNLLAPLVPYLRDTVFARGTSAEGPQSVSVQLVDRAGNVSAVQTGTIVIDSLAPAGAIAILPGVRAESGFTDSTTVALDLTALPEPHGGQVQMKLANSQLGLTSAPLQPFVSPVSWPLASGTEGLHTVHLRLVDSAGNSSPELSASVTLDRSPPSPATATLQGSAVTNASSITIALATDTAQLSADAGITVAESLLFEPATSLGPMAFPGTAQVSWPVTGVDGPRVVYVRFRDRAGNDTIREVRFTRDTERPTGGVAVRGVLADTVTPSSDFTAVAQVQATLTTAGATEYVLVTSGVTCPSSGYQPVPTAPVTLTLPAPGTFTVGLCLRDAAQNVGGPYFASPIIYDASPPTNCALGVSGLKVDGTPAPGGKTARRAVTVSLPTTGCSEVPAQMAVVAGPVTCADTAALAWVPYAATSSLFLGGTDGLTDVRGCVRDRAGNVGTATPTSITLDTTPPQAPQVDIAAGAAWLNLTTGVSPQLTGTATGAPVDWAAVEAPAVPSTFSTAYGSPITLTFSGPQTVRTVNALFRDDVGNISAVASDSISIDLAAPTGTMTVTTPSGNAFTNSVSVEVTIAPVSTDVTELFLVRGGTGACSAADFTAATPGPFTPTSTFLLSAGDGPKRVCGKVRDRAGNESALFDRSVTLDTVAPTEPRIVTRSEVRNLANNTPFIVTTSAPTTEANFARYEGIGGQLTNWTPLSMVQASTSFTFNVLSNATPSGVPNALRLRAVDQAGNVSPESLVVITTDIVPPGPVSLSTFAVDNRNDEASIYWSPSPDTDVVGYRVYYGRNPSSWAVTPHTYNGTFATQGSSPFLVGAEVTNTPLSGLTNGTLTYASVRAVDHAGNESTFPSAPSEPELMLQPNKVSPSLIAELSLAPMTAVRKIVVAQDRALVLGVECTAPSSTLASIRVVEVQLGALHGAFQRGSLGPIVAPTIVGSSSFAAAAGQSCLEPADLVLEGPYAFVAAGNTVSVHRLNSGSLLPTASNRIASHSLATGAAAALALNGSRLFVAGRGTGAGLSAIDVSSLYDQVAGTSFSPFGTAAQTGLETPGGLVSTRDRLITTMTNAYRLGDWSSATAWPSPLSGPTLNGLRDTQQTMPGQPAQSGNLVYLPMNGSLAVHEMIPSWNGSARATATLGAPQGVDLTADLLWAAESDTVGLRVLDLGSILVSPPSIATPVSTWQSTGLELAQREAPAVTAGWGPYRLVGTGSWFVTPARLQVLEVATPTAMQVSRRIPTRGGEGILSGAFLVTSQQSVVDFHSGPNPIDRGNFTSITGFLCFGSEFDLGVDAALVDEQLIIARGAGLGVVQDLTAPLGRSGMATRAQTYQVDVAPPGTRVAAVEAYGNFLVMVEDRFASGVWLEVYDLSPVRDHDATIGTRLTSASARASVRLGSWVNPGSSGSALMADIKIARGRAVVGLDQWHPSYANPTPGAYVVDLAAAFDDNPATTALTVVASLPTQGVRKVELNGDLVWLSAEVSAGGVGRLEAWPIAGALAPTPVPLTATAPTGSVLLAEHPEGLVVRGGWAFVATAVNATNSPGVYAYDISQPSSPRPVGFIGERSDNSTCSSTAPGTNSLLSDGHRLFFVSPSGTSIIELE